MRDQRCPSRCGSDDPNEGVNVTKKSTEDHLLAAIEMWHLEGGCPQFVFHPDFGWIIVDGKPTPAAETYLKHINEKGET